MNENKYRLLVFIVFLFYLMNFWIIFIINSMCFSSGYIRNRHFPILFQVWFCIAMQICGINNANIANNSGVQWGRESGIPRQIYCELKFHMSKCNRIPIRIGVSVSFRLLLLFVRIRHSFWFVDSICLALESIPYRIDGFVYVLHVIFTIFIVYFVGLFESM